VSAVVNSFKRLSFTWKNQGAIGNQADSEQNFNIKPQKTKHETPTIRINTNVFQIAKPCSLVYLSSEISANISTLQAKFQKIAALKLSHHNSLSNDQNMLPNDIFYNRKHGNLPDNKYF
jgi:hypothetical protein